MTKILVIVDNARCRDDFADFLTSEGYDVLTAENGVTGIESAFHNLPDLIICFIALPGLNGIEVVQELQAHPETAGIPVILLTNRSSCEALPDNYIILPCTGEELLYVVQTQLEKKAAQEREQQPVLALENPF